MASFEHTIVRIVEWLAANPPGAVGTEIATTLGLSYGHVSGALWQATQQKRIAWRPSPMGKASNRRHYFALHHVPAVFKPPAKVAKSRAPLVLGAGEAKTPQGVKFTRYEPPRVEVAPVPRVFGSLAIGSYLPSDSVISKVYR